MSASSSPASIARTAWATAQWPRHQRRRVDDAVIGAFPPIAGISQAGESYVIFGRRLARRDPQGRLAAHGLKASANVRSSASARVAHGRGGAPS